MASPIHEPYDFVQIGAGIVGLATAYTWLGKNPGGRVLVLEKEPDIAHHQSGRNSGVLHSGIYYKPGSLKAKNCVAGKLLMESFCREHDVEFITRGKLIVARDSSEVAALDELERRGRANGVELERCDRGRMKEIEPAISGVAAIFTPGTGVVDFREVCEALRRAILSAGGEILCAAKVTGIRVNKADSKVGSDEGAPVERSSPGERSSSPGEPSSPSEQSTPGEPSAIRVTFQLRPSPEQGASSRTILARAGIVCAGLQADRLGRLAGLDSKSLNLRIVPFRGEYSTIEANLADQVRGLVYPVPDPRFPFLGVHFTRRISGQVDCGPNAVPALGREAYGRFALSPRDLASAAFWPGTWKLLARHFPMAAREFWRSINPRAFAKEARRLLPGLGSKHLKPAPAGIRAQALDANGKLVDDYVIRQQGPLLHLLNAPSPAATSSLAIGRHLVEQLDLATARRVEVQPTVKPITG